MTQIVVGIDGGGSKTHVIVADESGTKLGEAFGPGSAVRPGQADSSADVIESALREALSTAGHAETRPAVTYIGVAGVGRDTQRLEFLDALRTRDLGADVIVQSDFSIALDDAFGDGPGILLIAGTGSVAFGRSPAGASARCGGWGPVMGDEGSGGWIGRRALSVVTSAADGREPPTALTGAVLTAAEVNDVTELVQWAGEATAGKLATLAPIVLSVANAGDQRANAIISLASEELMLHVRALARELFVDERAAIPLAFSGGLLSRGSLLRKRLEHRLKSAVPGATVKTGDVVAARGAVRAALRAASSNAAPVPS
jgi:glucosamine kinase